MSSIEPTSERAEATSALPSESITRTSFLLTALSLVVKPIGMVKEMAVAAIFGASATMDAFYIAIAIPNLVHSLLSGAILGGFTPLFLKGTDRQHRREVYGQALAALLIVVAAISGVIWVLRNRLPEWFAPGLGSEGHLLAAGLLFLLLPYLFFQVLVEFHRAVLVGLRSFVVVALLPVANAAAVVLILWFGSRTIQSLAVASGVGAGIMALTAVLLCWVRGFPVTLARPRAKHLRPLQGQIPFLLMSSVLLQINGMVDKIMASGLDAGSISALGYSYKLLMLLHMVFVYPLEGMLLAYLASDVAAQRWEQLVERMDRAIDTAILLVTPVVAFCLLFRAELIRILFERDAFDQYATLATGNAFAAYVPTVLVASATLSMPRYFNAVSRNGWLTAQTVMSVVLNLIFNWLFMRWWGHVGIALSTTITVLGGRLLLFWLAQRHLPAGHKMAMIRPASTLVLALLTTLITWGLRDLLDLHALHPYLQPLAGLLLTILCFLATYSIFRRRELLDIMGKLRGRTA